jgi:hypothetical protein
MKTMPLRIKAQPGPPKSFTDSTLKLPPRHCEKLIMIERAFSLPVKHLLVEAVPKSPHRIKKELITRLHHEKAATRFQQSSNVGEMTSRFAIQ